MWYKYEKDVMIITVYVQPGAKHTEITGLHGDALKIRLVSRPIEGRANNALLKFIAQLFEVPLRQVVLKSGDKSRYKKLAVIGSTIEPSMLIEPMESRLKNLNPDQ